MSEHRFMYPTVIELRRHVTRVADLNRLSGPGARQTPRPAGREHREPAGPTAALHRER